MPSAARRRFSVHSGPDSTDSTVWTSSMRGRPGTRPVSRSSTLGWVAPEMAMVQPSQLAPTIQNR